VTYLHILHTTLLRDFVAFCPLLFFTTPDGTGRTHTTTRRGSLCFTNAWLLLRPPYISFSSFWGQIKRPSSSPLGTRATAVGRDARTVVVVVVVVVVVYCGGFFEIISTHTRARGGTPCARRTVKPNIELPPGHVRYSRCYILLYNPLGISNP